MFSPRPHPCEKPRGSQQRGVLSRFRRGSAPSTAEPQTYEYKPLKKPRRQIRILTLFPGQADAPIHVALEAIPFKKGERLPEYAALSYTWGSDENSKSVHVVEGKHDCFVLPVTRNLHEVLVHLRQEKDPRLLWVDALCINQENDAEKSDQVTLMALIYPRALLVIAWLGPESEDSNHAFDAVQRISTNVTYNVWTNSITRTATAGPEWPPEETDTLPLHASEVTAFCNLLSRPWFNRAWIWQEVLLSVNHTLLMCGKRDMPWLEFTNAVESSCEAILPDSQDSMVLLRRLLYMRDLCGCYMRASRILRLLQTVRQCLCTNPRDRIYAALGLQHLHLPRLDVVPDYSLSVQEVYRFFVREYLVDAWGDLDFLIYAEKAATGIADLPSFVPDWTNKLAARPFPLKYAGAGTPKNRVTLAPDACRIKFKGIIACRIDKVIPYPVVESSVAAQKLNGIAFEFFDLVRECLPDLSDRQIDGLCRAVCCNSFNPWDEYATGGTLEETRSIILWFLRRGPYLPSSPAKNLAWIIFNLCRNRSLFISNKGEFGLASSFAQAGDILVNIPSCAGLMALRASKNAPGAYEVVSPAYYEGAMLGESMLGPLPAKYSFMSPGSVSSSAGGGPRVRGFMNLKTGEVELEDPRLPPLPDGWEQTRATSADSSAWYRNHYTLEQRAGFYNDPRLDLEFLETRGVRFQDFVLV